MLKIENFLSLYFPKKEREIFKSWMEIILKKKFDLAQNYLKLLNVFKAFIEIPTQRQEKEEGRKINVSRILKIRYFP